MSEARRVGPHPRRVRSRDMSDFSRRECGSGVDSVENKKAKIKRQTMALNIKPIGDRILVEPVEEKEVKKGGIIIPDTAKEKPQQGKVYAVGAGKVKDDGKRLPLDVKDGDTILFGKYSGQEIKIDGEEYLIMREDEVLAVLDSKGK
jgi:chaperonin GroES